MEKHILISPGLLQPIVNKCLNKFSEVQWGLLAAGTTDSDTQVALANMFTEIVQPSWILWYTRLWTGSSAQAGVNTGQEKFTPQLGDSLLTNFAVALLVPQEKCESAERLTKLIEQEISLKVISIVSTVMKSSCWPEELAVFASGAISHTEAFLMVSHAIKRNGNDRNNQTLCKQNFMTVTKKVFDLNMAALKQRDYIVNLTQESVSFRRDTADNNDPEYILPGAAPQTPRPQSEPYPWMAPPFEFTEYWTCQRNLEPLSTKHLKDFKGTDW